MKIRTASVADAEAIAAIYAPIVAETAISFEWVPPTVEEFRERIAKTLRKYAWLVTTDDAEQITSYVFAGSHKEPASYQWSVNTSVYIRADSRGCGVGKALYIELFRRLVSLGYHRTFAGIALPNPASVALHESVGFKPVGIYKNVGFNFGAWRDVSWCSGTCSRRKHCRRKRLRLGRRRPSSAAGLSVVEAIRVTRYLSRGIQE